jgi:hypothetical protein
MGLINCLNVYILTIVRRINKRKDCNKDYDIKSDIRKIIRGFVV